MKVVIYQSFRVKNVPPWITTCISSVEKWANNQGYDYRFFGDELFEKAPKWYRDKVNNQIHLTSDLARLYLARELLDEGYDKAVWIDADVLIFSPDEMVIPIDRSFSFSKEVYIDYDPIRNIKAFERVNNAIMLMSRDCNFLPFYIDAAESIIRDKTRFTRTAVGTHFLSKLNNHFPIDHINCLGLFSPQVMNDIYKGDGPALRLFCKAFKTPIAAANLCLTFHQRKINNINMNENLYSEIVHKLLETKGSFINTIIRTTH